MVNWTDIINDTGWRNESVAHIAGLCRATIWGISRCAKPRASTLEKLEKAKDMIVAKKKIPFHPSYGYATAQQIEKLKTLKAGVDRDYILKLIAEQTKNKVRVR